MRTHTRRWRIWVWGWKLEYTHSPVKSTMPIPCLSKWTLVFQSCYTTYHSAPHPAHSPQRLSSHNLVCHCLMFGSSNIKNPSIDNSPLHGRAEQSSPVQQHMPYHCTDDSFQDTTNEEEEDWQTAPLNDVWLEEPVPVRHLCIHEQSQPNVLSSYPCPYSLDLPPLAPEDTPSSYHETMDLNDISDFQDVMTTTSNEDIPDLDDVFGLWIWTVVWINFYISQTLYTWTNTSCMKQDGYITNTDNLCNYGYLWTLNASLLAEYS